ncbi:MAG: VPDSG-CTERM sorting domain-containing protein [Opitutales bacterium]|nr:VPDSG-CTERM sorting domain-containing protein [Opitutales bacterium]MBT5169947.1 VPDSG-CTERM sorting domain-containing protein [Opitutales bacterium]MBT5814058.1 VPDSG-CTERM sorting domain-containing protein [Opitutales bacterium]MBT6379230.1 VPDSG-CTERM sorting domain-containing protein [Opitutales bacterium]MBT6768179.1 VPDSG-CTERM sorting domain-containing protein [Opitutales bacterium]
MESDDYSGVTQFGSPLSGINNIGTYTGSRFAFYADFQDLQVDTNYVSGSLINSYAVYTNTLLSNMGIYQTNMSGTWTYNGVSETVNVLVGTAPPVPDTGSTAALLGVGVFVLAAARRRLG